MEPTSVTEGQTPPNSQDSPTPPAEPTAEQKLVEAEKKYLYLYAEFDTFKKRAFKERQDALKFGWEPVARDLLEVLDNLERAQTAAKAVAAAGSTALIQGLEMVIKEFKNTLTKGGVQSVEILGKPFDPNWAEAVSQTPSDQPQGTVCAEISKAYSFHGRLLRPARVAVSTGQGGQNPPLTGQNSSPA